MAAAPAPTAPTVDPRAKLQKEAKQRLQDCKAEKAKVSLDIEECYFFLAPRRVRSATSSTTTTKTGDEFELQTSLGFEVADDFMTMLIDSFMPPAAKWAERHPELIHQVELKGAPRWSGLIQRRLVPSLR